MGRPAKGTPEWAGDHWKIRITLGDGTRPWIHLDPTDPPLTEAQARREGARLAARARVIHAKKLSPTSVAVLGGELVEEYAGRWCTHRRKSGHSTVDDDEGRLRKHVLPHIGKLPVVAVTREHLEAIVEALDTKMHAGELSWKTTAHIWCLVTGMFADSHDAKVRALRVRPDNPAAGIRGPDTGAERSKPYLWPSEFLKLVSCEAVPLPLRRVYALSVYLYTRAGELEALDWSVVDLAHSTVHIHQAINRDADEEGDELKGTKTGTTRRMPIEPELMPLLEAMHREARGQGRVFSEMPLEHQRARWLRRDLKRAGVTRAELFAQDRTRKRLTFHDLRATGITWAAVRGDNPISIMRRAGHADFKTTDGYIREADAVREGFGTVFGPLPPSLYPGGVSSGLCPDGAAAVLEPPVSTADASVALTDDVSVDDPARVATRSDSSEELDARFHFPPSGHAPVAPADDPRTIATLPPRATEAAQLDHRAELMRALGRALARAVERGDDKAVAWVADAIASFRTLPPEPAEKHREETGT